LVSRFVLGLADQEAFSVGCCRGADALALSALVSAGLAARGEVFAVGSASGDGFWSGSARDEIRAAAAAGSPVRWLAGGPLSIPLQIRLARRSQACIRSVVPGGACFLFLSRPRSKGSLGTARFAASLGLQVYVFACGFSPSLLPGLEVGRWQVVSSGPLAGSVQWVPGVMQVGLFR
jgi:hypothetical protein